MPRPYGSQNLQIPDPPFIYEFGTSKIILMPKQDKIGTNDDGSDMFQWSFDGQVEIAGKIDEKNNFEMSLEELQAFEIAVKVSVRWVNKMEKEKEKLESQLEELQAKLAFLQR